MEEIKNPTPQQQEDFERMRRDLQTRPSFCGTSQNRKLFEAAFPGGRRPVPAPKKPETEIENTMDD